MLITKAIYEGKQFVHVRRSDVELKEARNKFFDDMEFNNEFPGYAFRAVGYDYQCIEIDPETGEPYEGETWTTIGFSRYLSGARVQKSIPMPKVWAIWFDEFILPKERMNQYLPDEVTSFLRLYDTIARMRDVRVFFVSNAESIINPYFSYFNIHIPYNTDACRIKEDIAFEMVYNPAFQQARRETRFGKLIDGTDYGKYAIENSFNVTRHSDIKRLSKGYNYLFSLVWQDIGYGVYRNDSEQSIIISDKYDSTYNPKINLSDKDGKLNKLMISVKNRHYYLKALGIWYINGFVYYDSLRVQQVLQPVLDKVAW